MLNANDIHDTIRKISGDYIGVRIPKLTEESLELLHEIFQVAKAVKHDGMSKFFWITAEDEKGQDEFFLIKLDMNKAVFVNGHILGDIENGSGRIMVYGRDDSDSEENGYDLTEILGWVLAGVKDVIEMLRAGTYEDYIKRELPYSCYSGVMKLNRYWKYCPEEKRHMQREFEPQVVDDFLKWHHRNTASVKGYNNMTFGQFCEACMYIYKYMGYDVEGLTPREAYFRYSACTLYGAGGNEKLRQLPEDDAEAFEKWMDTYHRGSHCDEIRFGRIWFWVERNISGRWNFFVADVREDNGENVRLQMVMDMSKAGYHMDAAWYSSLVKRLKGKCMVGLQPKHFRFDNLRAFYEDITVSEYTRYLPEPIPKEMLKEIRWLSPRICELGDDS